MKAGEFMALVPSDISCAFLGQGTGRLVFQYCRRDDPSRVVELSIGPREMDRPSALMRMAYIEPVLWQLRKQASVETLTAGEMR